ncbi:MAG: flagellar basal body P-ring protein FlgI [Nitrospira sp.]
MIGSTQGFQTTVTPDVQTDVAEEQSRLIVVDQTVTLGEVVRALNAVGVTLRETWWRSCRPCARLVLFKRILRLCVEATETLWKYEMFCRTAGLAQMSAAQPAGPERTQGQGRIAQESPSALHKAGQEFALTLSPILLNM